MAQVELIMPKMGESIMEATILKWNKQVGDKVEVDETVLEIATDKVDSEVPSPVSGTIAKLLYQENDTVEIGQPIALIATEGEEVGAGPADQSEENGVAGSGGENGASHEAPVKKEPEPQPVARERESAVAEISTIGEGGRFYSPLVRNIAAKENISMAELEQVPGSGQHGRVTKKDMLSYLETRKTESRSAPSPEREVKTAPPAPEVKTAPSPETGADGNVEIIEMDRMRKLIAEHMVKSKQTSAHVTSFVEVDVTNIVNWRNRIKKDFQDRHGEKITFTPIFIEAVTRAIGDFPRINISVDGDKILVKKNINVGMAVALPSGNLIVPVIKDADHLNLLGLTKRVNELAGRARDNKLKAEEIQGGTFTITNVGTFGNVMGTPIINQPQVAILATGAIRKKPAVVETAYGDLIAVRHMMFLSLSYDHRVVDGYLGGSFLRRVGDYLEQFDPGRSV
jgi:2-oxoglutarate dehydrogenase E2 component (dihydrolipoamide succinyltransferase)